MKNQNYNVNQGYSSNMFLRKSLALLTVSSLLFGGSVQAFPGEQSSVVSLSNSLVAKRAKANEPAVLKVPAKGGHFTLEVNLETSDYGAQITGTITNNTDRGWARVDFHGEFYDDDDDQLEGSHEIIVLNIKKGETKEIDVLDKDIILTDGADEIEQYDFRLGEATYDAKYVLNLTSPVKTNGTSFEDSNIAINWTFEGNQLGFELRNKTDNQIKINWNDVSYIDPSGNADNVIHEGVKYVNRNETLSPTSVPPTAKITDMVVPASNVNYVGGSWDIKRLFPEGEAAKQHQGKTFSVFMPLEINGKTKNYTFTFNISDIKF